VDNLPPTPTIVGPNNGVEGSILRFTGSATDPSPSDVDAGFTFAWWVTRDGVRYASGTGPDLSFVPDDNGTYIVELTATDRDGGAATVGNSVVVANLPPSSPVLVGLSGPLAVGSSTSVSASFSDPGGRDTHTCRFSWGDGTIVAAASASPCTATHAYSQANIYAVEVVVTDNDGASASARYDSVIVFDPKGGTLGGAGALESAPGAYPAAPRAAGPAIFAFASRYLTASQSVPSGVTQLTLPSAKFTFRGSSLAWLVISGERAQARGEGTVNQVPGYAFLLTAIDGNVLRGGGRDRLRFKVWRRLDGQVVYDNIPGPDALSATPTQPIAAGNVVILR
jgi:hypothetical protein